MAAVGETFGAMCSTLGPGFACCIGMPLHKALAIPRGAGILVVLTPQRAKQGPPRPMQNICARNRVVTSKAEVETKEGVAEGGRTEEDGVNALRGTRQGAVFPEKGMHAEVTWTRLGG